MSQKKLVMDGFVRDETGTWHIVPMKLPDNENEREKKKEFEKKTRTRNYIPIERLKLTPAGELQISPKRRKVEKPVRKELFKMPQKKTDRKLSFNTHQSKKSRTSRISKINNSDKISTFKKEIRPLNDGSPLLDIDEAEELLAKNNSVTLQDEKENITDIPTPGKYILATKSITPGSNQSDIEFVHIEKAFNLCQSVKKDTESPTSAVCALLKNTRIDNCDNKYDVIFNEVRSLMEKDKNEYEILKQQFTTYCSNHEKIFTQISGLLDQLANHSDNKQNSVRRSNRLGIPKEKINVMISPEISKKVDLRKTTLNNNLTKTLQPEQSPRMKKAVNLYNSIRTDYAILSTPKLERTNVLQSSVTRSLSRRIQNQCLLLQDTPKPCEY